MPAPARQRILDAALRLIQERGIGRVTTREIALAAGAAEGSLFKNFGDKMGLLTALLSYELPENQAWRAVAIEAPPGHGDLVAGLVLFMERAIDYYAATLPITAPNWPWRPASTACAAGRMPVTSTGRPISTRWPSPSVAAP